jgi:plasmid stabilization system protein ParE
MTPRYLLTECAEADLTEARAWSLARWGKALTEAYFADLHAAALYVAAHHTHLATRDLLTQDIGLSVYPVREHYLAYVPITQTAIIIVAVIRQGRDLPGLLRQNSWRIARDVKALLQSLSGPITLPFPETPED